MITLAETVLQDLRYAVRVLWRNRGFTTVAVFALALGIGVNTAAFTAYKAFFVRSVDARNPATVVNLALNLHSGATDFSFSYPDYQAYRDSLHSFSGLIAERHYELLTLSGQGGMVSQRASQADSMVGRLGLFTPGVSNAEFASTFIVSENYFSVLGVAALRGRTFDSVSIPEISASPSVLISENYWRRRFAGDPAIVGKTIRLNGAAFTVIGITPHDFVGTGIAVPDFWLPLTLEPLIHPNESWLHDREDQCCRLFGRLAPGVSIAQAQAEVTLLADRLRALHSPDSELGKRVTALVWPGSPFPLPLDRYRGLEFVILLIMLAVGMVLVVACGNVASLQLARATSRQNELSTRLSLGASRGRVIRQLLTESAVLGLLAGVVALVLSSILLDVGVTLIAGALPPEEGTLVFHVSPDLGVFAYVLAISLIAGILLGLVPAVETSRPALFSALRANTGTSPLRSRRLQNLFVATQVAVSLVLMIAGSMLIRSSIHSVRMDPGYDDKQVIDLDFQFPEWLRYTAGRKAALVREIRARVAALPGVAAITSARAPADGTAPTTAVSLNGQAPSAQNEQASLYYTYVQANYFQTLRIPLSVGRSFQGQAGAPEHSVILSESAAKRLWPGQNPVGRTLRLGTDGATYQVVGVARDTRGYQLDGSDSEQVYVPLPEGRLQDYSILIRTESNPTECMRAIERVVSSLDPNLLASSTTLEDMLRQTPLFMTASLAAAVASTLGLLGLLLASMGIYGTVSYVVALRTREVGIRIAIGATKRDILVLMLRESTRPVLRGLLVGVFLAVGASFLLRQILYGLGTIDGISFAAVSLLFFAVALLAAYLPSRRAMRVDPMSALRSE